MQHEVRVFVEGVWDLMHYNHIEFLLNAKSFGTHLIVGVVSDASVETYKRRPILTEDERLRTVKALPFVDEAFIYSGPFVASVHQALVVRTKADVVVYGSPGFDDYYSYSIKKGMFRRLEYRQGLGSSMIIERVKQRILDMSI